mmetsp:Transcript_14634/g.37389  ORF Transcript_14634/g.37389 Transcript_14634/m.37389 type:complete len:269 (+) Transcript_14634:112-918(+)
MHLISHIILQKLSSGRLRQQLKKHLLIRRTLPRRHKRTRPLSQRRKKLLTPTSRPDHPTRCHDLLHLLPFPNRLRHQPLNRVRPRAHRQRGQRAERRQQLARRHRHGQHGGAPLQRGHHRRLQGAARVPAIRELRERNDRRRHARDVHRRRRRGNCLHDSRQHVLVGLRGETGQHTGKFRAIHAQEAHGRRRGTVRGALRGCRRGRSTNADSRGGSLRGWRTSERRYGRGRNARRIFQVVWERDDKCERGGRHRRERYRKGDEKGGTV